jgi:hypothetical protein
MSKPSFWQFLRTTGSLGLGSVFFCVAGLAIGLFEHAYRAVTVSVFVALTIAAFLWGSYLSWLKERQQVAELQLKAARPKLIFTATPLPDSSWDQLEQSARQSAPIFTVTHVAGDVARFIQVQRIQSARKADADRLYVQFDQIDFLDSVKREENPNFELFLSGRPRGKGKAGNLGFTFFQMDADVQKSSTVKYPVTVTYDWNGQMLQEKVTLTWNAITQSLKTSRFIE